MFIYLIVISELIMNNGNSNICMNVNHLHNMYNIKQVRDLTDGAQEDLSHQNNLF